MSRCLAGGLELYGVYGPSVAARDLASLARACRAFVPIARDGFQELAADVARQEDAAGEATTQLLLHAQQHVEDLRQFAEQQRELPDNEEDWWEQDKRTLEPPEHDGALHLPAGLEWGFWDALLADPAGLKAADLKRGAAALGLEVRTRAWDGKETRACRASVASGDFFELWPIPRHNNAAFLLKKLLFIRRAAPRRSSKSAFSTISTPGCTWRPHACCAQCASSAPST